jgi:hypothetical protein
MKKNTYGTPTVIVRGDVIRETLGFKFPPCQESKGRLPPCPGSDLSFGL